jgi:uncharacterized membrane protein
MKEWLVLLTESVIPIIDMMALMVVTYGAIEGFIGAVRLVVLRDNSLQNRNVWLRFARLLVAGLTFQLAADIIETSISSSWEALGQIAAIAVIRTFLNYFLEKDVERLDDSSIPTRRRNA